MRAVVADITNLAMDAIVNTANSTLLGGGGVDGAIHRAAGPQLLAACKEIRHTQLPSGLPTGQAVITPGFLLPARYVIHTVGPNRYAGENDPQLLSDAFSSSARCALTHNLHTIAFPAISAGAYGWDMHDVARIGVDALQHFPALDITIALISEHAQHIWESQIAKLADISNR